MLDMPTQANHTGHLFAQNACLQYCIPVIVTSSPLLFENIMNWKNRRSTIVHNSIASPMHTWQAPGTSVPKDGYDEYYRSTPSRLPNLESDVLVPLAQALITGIMVGLIAFGLIWPVMGFRWAVSGFLGTFGLITAGVWATLVTGYYRMLSTVEEIVTDPPPAKELATVEITMPRDKETGYRSLKKFHLPAGVTIKSLDTFLTGITNGRAITLDLWAGKGGQFSRTEFNGILANLADANYIEFKNPNHPQQGRVLTTNGRKAIVEYLHSN